LVVTGFDGVNGSACGTVAGGVVVTVVTITGTGSVTRVLCIDVNEPGVTGIFSIKVL